MATAEVTIIPMGRAGASISDLLAEVARHLDGQDAVRYEMHAMGTNLEGDVHEILRLTGEIQEIPLMLGVPRVYTVLKIDSRVDRDQSLDQKEASVRERLEAPDELPSVTRPE